MGPGFRDKAGTPLAAFMKSAFSIRPWPLLVGLACAVALSLTLLFRPAILFSVLPEWLCNNEHTRLQWNVVHAESVIPDGERVYIVGGSQVVQGFPGKAELSALGREYLGGASVMEVAFSGENMLETLILLTHLPVDGSTYVFIQVSPYRLAGRGGTMEQCRLLLDPSEALSLLAQAGYPMDDSERTSRIVSQLTILATRALRPWDKFSTERKYLNSPTAYVAGVMPAATETAGTEAGAVSEDPISTMAMLRIVANYVHSRGGHVYLFDMPFNYGFPREMPGWSPQEHSDPAVKAWLERVEAGNGNAQGGQYDAVFQRTVRETGLPLVPFHARQAFTQRDFYDSVHLLKAGRDKFLPSFFAGIGKLLQTPEQNENSNLEKK